MSPDTELLNQYARTGDEAAFAEVVRRNVDLVYSAAVRLVGGDAHLAEDVTQQVFTALARQARGLAGRNSVTGWLYTTARFSAAKIRRGERRRFAREQEAYVMNETTMAEEISWERLQPALDEAVGALGAEDREAVLLRFFQNKSHREVGEALGWSEDTARKRVERALEKLRGHFARRGVTVAAALVAEAVAANAVQAAPAGLAMTLSTTALAGAGSAGTAGFFGKIFAMTTKTKIAVGAAVVMLAAATTATLTEHAEISRLRAALAAHSVAAAAGSPTGAAPTTADRKRTLSELLKEDGRSQLQVTRELLDFVDGLKPGEIRGMLDLVNTLPMGAHMAALKKMLLQRWTENDPAAAIAWVKAEAHSERSQDDLSLVFMAWGERNMAGAFAALNLVDDANQRKQIGALLFVRMANADPQAALSTLLKLPIGQRMNEYYDAIFYVWGGQNPAAAAAAVMGLPPSVARLTAIATLAHVWAGQDPKAVLAWADTLPADSSRKTVRIAALQALAVSDPQATTAYLSSLPSAYERGELIKNIASSWAATDPTAALAWVNQVANGKVHTQAVEGILGQMSQTIPVAVAGYLDQAADKDLRDAMLPQLAAAWAQKDIAGALAWAQALPATDASRSQANENVISVWAQNDPVSAGAYLLTIPGDPNMRGLADQVARNWAMADPAAALDWVQKLPPGSPEQNALRTVLSTYADVDPPAAWAETQALADDGSHIRQKIMANIVMAWSSQDPAQAAAALETVPTANVTYNIESAGATVATNWLAQDPAGAAQWIENLPKGHVKDGAMVPLIQQTYQSDPATAFNMAWSMTSQDLRGQMVNQIIPSWAKQDPAAAEAAVMSVYPDSARRTQILKTIQQSAPKTTAAPAGGVGP